MAFWDKWSLFGRRAMDTNLPLKNNTEVAAVTDRMLNNLALAEAIYSDQSPWLAEDQPPLTSTGLGALIASEVARLVTIECKMSIDPYVEEENEETRETTRRQSSLGVDKATILNNVLQRYLMRNLRVEVEKGWALGGLILKPYFKNADFVLGLNDEVLDISGNMRIAFMYPSQFLINNYDNSGTVFEIMFFTTITQNNKYYTLVEKQSYDEKTSTLTITNKLYETHTKPTKYRWDDLGTNIVPLSSVEKWQNILPKVVFPDVRGTLVGFYKPAVANNTDINSPYGMSGLVRAAEAIRRADRTYNGLDWEMDTSLARLFVDERAVAKEESIPTKVSKFMVKLLGMGDNKLFEKYSPEIRDENYLRVYNSHVRAVEAIVGLAYGSISDVSFVDKTATEYKMSQQRSFATVVDNQKALELAVTQLAYAMSVWLEPTVIINPEDIDMTFDFDDSIVSNPDEQVATMLMLQGAGNIPAYRTNMTYFNINKKDAQILVDEAKKSILEAIESESDANAENEFE